MENYLLGIYEKGMPGNFSIKSKLVETRKAGFDFMELSIDETDEKLARLNWGNQETREIIAAMDETGTPIKSICLSGHRRFPLGDPDPDVQKKSLAIMQKAIILSARLGVRIIQMAGYDVYYKTSNKQTCEIFAENLALSVNMAAKEGVILAFETMETEFMNTVEKAQNWVSAMRSPYLQIYPDIGNIMNASLLYGTDVLDDLASGQGHLVAVHLKETVPNVFREVPYGSGHVDFSALIAKSLWLGVKMFVGEFWHTGEENWQDVIKTNYVFLLDALKKGQVLAKQMN